ncbi:MAG: sulfur carrier protein ThiS [Myxococcales bacterium]|nr:sulfur carrier protein ThiS [Myxococcales bacterium]
MRIVVNGEPREAREGATVGDLLRALELDDAVVAVERNAAIVRRAEHATTPLADGDTIEVVQFVGGG